MSEAKSRPKSLGFTWRTLKSGEVVVERAGRTVATLRGPTAVAFLAAAAREEPAAIQQRLARLTGNYRRGNERAARRHPRNR
jgi:hypothetical protein